MKQSTTILATLACAQAIKLNSQVEFIPGLDFISDIPDVMSDGLDIVGGGLEDFGDIMLDGIDITMEGLEDIGTITYDGLTDFEELTIEGLDTIGEGLIDFGEITKEGFDTGAYWVGGATYDLGDFIIDDIGDFVVDDIGDFVVDDIGSGVEDSWNWASDGGNWEAAGKTLGAGSVLILQGDFDEAGQVLGNDEHYTKEFYDDMDKADEAKQNYETMLREHQTTCAAQEPKVGENVPGSRNNMSMEFNDEIMINNIDFVSIYSLFGPNPDANSYSIDPRECEDVDCLHPCYGTLGECNKCANHFLSTGERHSICDSCQILSNNDDPSQ